MIPPDLTRSEMEAIENLNTTMRTIGSEFIDGNGDPGLLYVAVDVIRDAADTLERLADRWSADVQSR